MSHALKRHGFRKWISLVSAPALVVSLLAAIPASPASALGGVVINEILADPASGTAGDSNGDGTRDFGDDEFVEIYNDTGSDLDLSGWTLSDGFTARHTFPAASVVPTDCAIVVFGGPMPTGVFGGAVVQTASGGSLGLNNGGDTLTLNDGTSDVAVEAYGSEGGDNQSLTRDPDITGSLAKHSVAIGSGGALFSPGTAVDGSLFAGCFAALGASGSSDPELTASGDNILLTVEVFPATVPDSTGITVEGDLSTIGGSATQAFNDDGGNSFSVTASVSGAPGDYSLPISASDAEGRTAATTISLSIVDVRTIMEIQGTGQVTPFDDVLVETSGIVTAITSNGRDAWIQDPDGDGDPDTSDGIAVDDFDRLDPTPAIGDLITIRGEAEESQFFPDLPKTRIDDTVLVSIDSSGNALPDAIKLKDLPNSSILDGIDFWEALEGMLVSVDEGHVVAPTTRFGEFGLLTKKDAKSGSGYEPSVSQILLNNTGPNQVDYNPERILVDDSTMGPFDVRPGERVSVTGVVDYSFGMYKLQPTDIDINGQGLPDTPVAKRSGGNGNTVITTYNVENLFDLVLNPDKDDASSTPTFVELETHLTKLRNSIVEELQLPEIMVLQEVENTEIAQELGDRVNAVAGNDYVAVSEETSDGRGIEVAFLYDDDRVTLVESHQLTGTDVEAAFGPPSPSPGREPLYGKFEIGNETVHIIGNHFKSKGGDTPPFGAIQPFERITEVQRKLQAQVVRDFADTILGPDPDALVMVTGDLNDFQFGEPGEGTNHTVAILEDGAVPLTNLVQMEKQSERYSFIFDGNSQVLDHMLLSPELLDRLDGTDFLHFNAAYPASLSGDITTTLRASDHDPLEGRFDFDGAEKGKVKPDKDIVQLQVLTVSDWHAQLDPLFVFGAGTFGGAAELSTYFDLERAKNPNTLTLTAGDAYGAAPPLSNFFDEEPAVRAMRLMGFDYDTFGNHNFDGGIADLQNLIDIANAGGSEPGESFQYLSANLENRDDNLSGVKDYEIAEMDGVKVAVIGVTNPEAPTLVFPGSFGTIVVTDPVVAANDARAEAEKKGATVFILLTHSGVTGDDGFGNPTGPLVDLANGVSGFDLIVGDHTDAELGLVINDALVVENQSRGRTYARIGLTIEKGKDGGVLSSSVDFIDPVSDEVVPDQAIVDLLAPLRAQLDVLLSVVVGESLASDGVTPLAVPRSDECGQSSGRTCESLVGNVVTDAMRTTYGTDFAITNAGGLRASLTCPATDIPSDFCNPGDEGKITEGQVLTVLPFGNSVVTLDVTGAELKAHLERGVSAMPGVSGRFGQVSGLCFTYDVEGAVGSRVTGAVFQNPDGTCSATAVDLTAGSSYTLAENDFTSSGGDGYPDDFGTAVTRELLDQVAAAYIAANTPISPAIQGRITCTDSVGVDDCPVPVP